MDEDKKFGDILRDNITAIIVVLGSVASIVSFFTQENFLLSLLIIDLLLILSLVFALVSKEDYVTPDTLEWKKRLKVENPKVRRRITIFLSLTVLGNIGIGYLMLPSDTTFCNRNNEVHVMVSDFENEDKVGFEGIMVGSNIRTLMQEEFENLEVGDIFKVGNAGKIFSVEKIEDAKKFAEKSCTFLIWGRINSINNDRTVANISAKLHSGKNPMGTQLTSKVNIAQLLEDAQLNHRPLPLSDRETLDLEHHIQRHMACSIFTIMGHVFERNGDFKNARIVFEKAIQICGEQGQIKNQALSNSGLGDVKYRDGNYYGALDQYEESIKLDSLDSLSHINICRTFYNVGDRKGLQLYLNRHMATLKHLGIYDDLLLILNALQGGPGSAGKSFALNSTIDTTLLNEGFDTLIVHHDPISGKFGYTDGKGNWIVNPTFDYAEPFIFPLAMVKANDYIGYMRKDGKLSILPDKYTLEIGSWKNCVWLGEPLYSESPWDYKFDVYRLEGGKIIRIGKSIGLASGRDRFWVSVDNKLGMINLEGTFTMLPKFCPFELLTIGKRKVLSVCEENGCGVLDIAGSELLPCEYDSLIEFTIIVSPPPALRRQAEVIDKFDNNSLFRFALLRKGRDIQIIDEELKVFVMDKFLFISKSYDESSGLIVSSTKDKYRFASIVLSINKEMKCYKREFHLSPNEYNGIESLMKPGFFEGYLLESHTNGSTKRYGLADKYGKQLVEPEFLSFRYANYGNWIFSSNDQEVLALRTGKVIRGYDKIFAAPDGIKRLKTIQDGLIGYIDLRGRSIVGNQYIEGTDYFYKSEGIHGKKWVAEVVDKSNKRFLIDEEGNRVKETE